MDLLRKYMLSTAFLRAPDGDGAIADPPAAADPPIVAAADPPEAEVVAEPPPERAQPPKWALDRISAETARAQEAEERERALQRRVAEAEALATRLQRGTDPATPQAPTTPQPAQDIDSLVNQRAQQLRLNEDSTAVRSAGMNKFGAAFGDTLAVLNAVGALSDDIVLDLVAVDKSGAHEILANLAQDPEKAASFAKLDPRRRIAELTRMSDALKLVPAPAPAAAAAAAPAKTVSKAPAPPPPIEPSASKVTDGYADEATDDQFTAQFNERMKARANRR